MTDRDTMNKAQRAQLTDEHYDTIREIADKHGVQWLPANETMMRELWQAAYAAGAAAARDEVIERFSRKYGHALWDTYCLCETMDDPFRSAAHVVIDEINFRATGHHFDAEAIRARQKQVHRLSFSWHACQCSECKATRAAQNKK